MARSRSISHRSPSTGATTRACPMQASWGSAPGECVNSNAIDRLSLALPSALVVANQSSGGGNRHDRGVGETII